MKTSMVNSVSLFGYLYESNLTMKTAGVNAKNPGMNYIYGDISVATNKECTNIVKVYYRYVTPTTSKGNANQTFQTLADIYNGLYKSVMSSSVAEAARLRIDSSIMVNDFYSSRSGKEELVSTQRVDGGFIHIMSNSESFPADESNWNRFKCDMVITNMTRQEANPERGLAEKVILRGCVFGFRNAIQPVTFSVTDPAGMTYFEGLGIAPGNPQFIQVHGKIVAETIRKTTVTNSFGWGEAFVDEVQSSRRDFVITGMAEPYVWDDPKTITTADLQQAVADRNLYLASIKQRQDNQRRPAAAATVPTNTAASFSDFKF